MGVDSTIYKILLLLHIVTVVVGLGAVSLNALYGMQSRTRQGPEGRAIAEATQSVGQVARYVVYLIPVFGILLILASDKAYTFKQTWVSLSFVLYIVAMGISHGVMSPNVRKMIELRREIEAGPAPAGGPPPQAAELAKRGQMVSMAGAALNLLMVALIALMIWKPGFP